LFSAMTFDQRGDGYARVLNGRVDIGAVEFPASIEPPPPLPTDKMIDFVFIVDESGSASSIETVLEELVLSLHAVLQTDAYSVRYGLVGFAATFSAGFAYSHLIGDAPFGSIAGLVTALESTPVTGGFEDGWEGIDHGLAEYQFRPGAAVNVVLLQNGNGRNTLNTTLTKEGILSALGTRNAVLNSIVMASFDPNLGNPVLGVESDSSDGLVDGQHVAYGIVDNAVIESVFVDGVHSINGADNTADTYVDLAWQTGGAAWNVTTLESGSPLFQDAFIDSLAQQIESQLVTGNIFRAVDVVAAVDYGADATQAGIGFSADPLGQGIATAVAIDLNSNSIPADIAPAALPDIFQNAREAANGQAINLAFPLSNGSYTVELFFAEIESVVAGERLFNVVVEGAIMLQNYDVAADRTKIEDTTTDTDGRLLVSPAGINTATVKKFEVVVSDGQLNVDLNDVGGSQGPLLSALRIVKEVDVPELRGDYNLNGVVDAADYVVWRKTLGTNVTLFSGADGNGSSVIDQPDYSVWRTNFGETLPPGSGAIAASDFAIASASDRDFQIGSGDQPKAQVFLNVSIPTVDSKFLQSKRAIERAPSNTTLAELRDLIALLVEHCEGFARSEDELFQSATSDEVEGSDGSSSSQFQSIAERLFENWWQSPVGLAELDLVHGSAV